MMIRKVAVLRNTVYSPHSVDNDKAILLEVADRMGIKDVISEKDLPAYDAQGQFEDTILFLSMGRMSQTIKFLTERKKQGAVVLNNPQGVAHCARSYWQQVMKENHWPMPAEKGTEGHWVKRGDAAAQTAADVVFVPRGDSVSECVERFHERGVKEVTVTAHVPGDVVKFYGVLDTGFFRYYYPSDDGFTKFGLERVNGPARHFTFNVDELQIMTEKLARLLEVQIYGGDCIVDERGRFFLIDFNDWPSFSRCRTEAAEAITRLATKCLELR